MSPTPDRVKSAVIFGSSGQDGFYLSEALTCRGFSVIGVSRRQGSPPVNVASFSEVESLLRQSQPSWIFHLAANSNTRHEALLENHATIETGTLNVLEAARRHCPLAKVFVTGSGLQFANNGGPIDEQTPFDARSPYALARISSVYAARYFRRLGHPVRSFQK